jgi:signal transduction histidine kinase
MPPRLQDLALAIALTLVNVVTLLPYHAKLHPLGVALVLVAAQAAPLVWRRCRPVEVFLLVGAARILYDRLGLGYAPLPLGPAIAYYTVMERCQAWVRWALSAVLLAGIIFSQALPGHTEPYEFFVAVLIFVAAGMAGVLGRTRRAYVAEVESRAERAELDRDREVALAAARERTGIARELHDVVAHHVSLMAVQAEAAASLLPGKPEDAKRSVEIISDTARQALTELRRLLGVLRGPAERPRTTPSPSLGGLDVILDQVRDAGLHVTLRVEGQARSLAPGVDMTAYRIVQEALTNAIRHASAATATVTLCYEPDFVTVSIADSGDGRTAAPAPAANGRYRDGDGGFGLAGIAERVASCGGSLAVGPQPQGGFTVTARLPVR